MEAQQMNSDIVSAPSVVCYPWASKLSTQSSWEAALLRGRPEGPAAFHRFPRPSWDKKHPWFEKRQNQVGGANYDTGGRKVKFNCQIPGPFVGIMVQYIKTYTHARAHTHVLVASQIYSQSAYTQPSTSRAFHLTECACMRKILPRPTKTINNCFIIWPPKVRGQWEVYYESTNLTLKFSPQLFIIFFLIFGLGVKCMIFFINLT